MIMLLQSTITVGFIYATRGLLSHEAGVWLNGRASAYGAEGSRFDPWHARIFFAFSLVPIIADL